MDSEEEAIREKYSENGTLAALHRYEQQRLDDLREETEGWLEEFREATKKVEVISGEALNKPSLKKATLAELLADAYSVIESQYGLLSDLQRANGELKTELLGTQSKMIRLQEEQLKCNAEQLQSLQTTVQSTVKDTMQSEIKSYSSVLTAGPTPAAVISPDALKKVVQAVVEEEDRSRNVILFGLSEENAENLSGEVGDLFGSVDEKPTFVASRIGKKIAGKARPVKVTLSGNVAAQQILYKAKRLRSVEKFKSVFVSPDMSPDERARHRQLILDLKRTIAEQPAKKHFIRQ